MKKFRKLRKPIIGPTAVFISIVILGSLLINTLLAYRDNTARITTTESVCMDMIDSPMNKLKESACKELLKKNNLDFICEPYAVNCHIEEMTL